MKTKYICEKCADVFSEKEIAYKYVINMGGKNPVIQYICKECEKDKNATNK